MHNHDKNQYIGPWMAFSLRVTLIEMTATAEVGYSRCDIPSELELSETSWGCVHDSSGNSSVFVKIGTMCSCGPI
ncbi:hypothetical protein M404DRAFT_624359 [Pisolithus tinctorius Marx 270]|uniref:Uncharacterized protein n=1 Tax=Pisolithus tinctorius Marx 270 TaxID=870435 RepID=A0A0C3K1V0_PISTI|nr:hypothetical protein M404DRAFT_624359 [Pisolithus tinctorius Marx 270]